MKLYCLKYNNYYNRIVKKEDTLADYLSKDTNYVTINNVSFNPADGVDTTQVINTSVNGDYVIVAKDDNTIISRWFIIEARRERTGQYTLTLHRDLIVDNYEKVINSPCFIEKATLDADDVAIYNKEDMTFNQVKVDEYTLQDDTECPWLVLYVAKNFTGRDNADSVIDNNATVDYYGSANTLENWKFYSYIGNEKIGAINRTYYDVLNLTLGSGTIMRITTDGEVYSFTVLLGIANSGQLIGHVTTQQLQALASARDTKLSAISMSDQEELVSWNGKVLRTITPLSYQQISVTGGTPFSNFGGTPEVIDTSDTLYNLLLNIWNEYSQETPTSMRFYYSASTFKASNTPISISTYRYNLSNTVMDKKRITTDAPYNVWCLPYGEITIMDEDGNQFTTNKEVSMLTVQQLLKDMETFIYDAQLLPYCPLVNNITRLEVDVDKISTDSAVCSTIVQGTSYEQGTPVSAILFADKASFTTNITHSMPIHRPIKRPIIHNRPQYINSLEVDMKIENECYTYRLCSPNYNGLFEFSVAKNEGVNYFNVDCTYKPYSPYIHVNPNFKGMYYQDFNDCRGLICGGDFSISRISDAFKQYEINNKNYVNIFDREIQNLEVQQKAQRIEQSVGAITGSLGAGLQAGIYTGSPVIGGIAGGVSAIGGAADYAIGETLRNEALDYKKDMYGYQLGNIKALPYSLSKVDAFNDNNKIFPFIETYSASSTEIQAFKDKMKYNGMTVGRIGTIAEFIRSDKTYIKGQLIRNEDIVEDFHYLNALSEEIYKGAFY